MGLIISIVPKGTSHILQINPSGKKTLIDNFPQLLEWSKNHLHTLPEYERDCKIYFEKIYERIPKDTNYFFAIEQSFSRVDDQLVTSYCKVIGPGSNIVDAYSTQLLFPSISQNENPLLKKGGFFTKATKDNVGVITFERMDDPYDLTVIAANNLSREKLRKMALQIPTNQDPIPAELQYAKFWTDITQNYTLQLKEKQAFDEIKKLNDLYSQSEIDFYNNLKLYQEYKEINAKLNSTYTLINLVLQGSSTAASTYQNTKMQNELNQIKKNETIFANELNKVYEYTDTLYQRTETLRIKQLNYLRTNHIPINDAPQINNNWRLN